MQSRSKITIGQDRTLYRQDVGYGYVWHLLTLASRPVCGSVNGISSTQKYDFPAFNLSVRRNGVSAVIPQCSKLTELSESFLCVECVNAGLRSLLQDSSSNRKRVGESSGSEVREQSPSDLGANSDPSEMGVSAPAPSSYYNQYLRDYSSGIGQTTYPQYVGEGGSLSTPSLNYGGVTQWNNPGQTSNGVRRSGYSRLRARLTGRS